MRADVRDHNPRGEGFIAEDSLTLGEKMLDVQSRHLERVEFESLWVGCPAF
jgi:hypothetical protein